MRCTVYGLLNLNDFSKFFSSNSINYLRGHFYRSFVLPNLERLGNDRIAADRVYVALCYVFILENVDDSDETLLDKFRAMSEDQDFDVKRTACKNLDSKQEGCLF